ncbi:MAG TPA: hypothetical protein VJG64_03690 [Candidatus Paceibacterota bacterium]
MTKTVVQNRVRALEAEVRVLKAAVLEKPDLSIDEKNWQKVKGTSKKIRAKLYKARYE